MSTEPPAGAPLPPDARRPLPGPGGPGVPPGPLAPPDNSSLTGTWLANDGGMYFLRQVGDALWWMGLSGGFMYPGLQFCNVFHASVTGSTVTGEWSDVPRGATSGRGTLTLRFANDSQLLRVGESGGFGASIWRRTSSSPWPVIVIDEAFTVTLKNVVKNWHVSEKSTLADNLGPLRDSVSVFAVIAESSDHPGPPVTVGYPGSDSPLQSFTYSDFICLNDPSTLGAGDQPDGDVTFWFQADVGQIVDSQPRFYAGVEDQKGYIYGKLTVPIEGEIIMFGRSADCGDDGAETSGPLFPGWAEHIVGSSVLFNGKPIRVIVLPEGGNAPAEPNFLTELSFGDPARVTGALAFDNGHGDDDPDKLEIHPVYSVDKITATFSEDLSGAWTDDIGNTYYLHHDQTDNTVWYAGVSPLGWGASGQVFRGTFYPRQVIGEAAVPAGIGGPPVLLQNAVAGTVIAIEFGYGAAPPFGTSGSRLGDTGAVTFGLGRTRLAGRDVPTLSTGDVRLGDYFRLMKLYDA